MSEEAETPAVTMTRMAMGSDVPEWLLAAEPRSPGAFLDKVRFSTDVMLLEFAEFYIIEPVIPGDQSLFDTGRSHDCLFIATSKPVRVPTGIWTFALKGTEVQVVPFADGRMGQPTPPAHIYNPPAPVGNIPQAINFPAPHPWQDPRNDMVVRRGVLRRAWDWLFG